MSDEVMVNEEDEEYELPPATEAARASASCGITIQVGHHSAWPKFEFSDNALPGESSEELLERVNSLTLEGAFNMAEKTRWLMTEQSKKSNK